MAGGGWRECAEVGVQITILCFSSLFLLARSSLFARCVCDVGFIHLFFLLNRVTAFCLKYVSHVFFLFRFDIVRS